MDKNQLDFESIAPNFKIILSEVCSQLKTKFGGHFDSDVRFNRINRKREYPGIGFEVYLKKGIMPLFNALKFRQFYDWR